MSNIGSLVLNVMAVIWAAIALAALKAPMVSWLAPAAVSAGIFWITRNAGEVAASDAAHRHVGRVVALASAAEGVGILIGINVATWLGRPHLWISVLAGVVGLHFLPLARWMPAPLYYLTAAALVADAAAGAVIGGPARVALVAGAAAIIVWATALSALAGRRA